ncbi:hypothetical protein F7725_002745 [Dissostichus mawsoni]|uniref:Uncharacterized protein n=1 Tax=Dissostichus mawsoni TaxID=36200 RepID=A0A7J5YAT6_DISMA|nr:hypothetical protein F7725_002745 [Dissostichus mawsoni]
MFDSLWSMSTGNESYGVCSGTKSDGVCAQLYEALQLPLMDDASCLLDMDGLYCAIVQQNHNFSVVHLNPCNSTGMPLDYGRSVALFHSSFPELMLVVTVRVNEVLHCVPGVAHSSNIAEKREQASSSEVKSSGSAPNLKRRLSVPEGVALKKCSVPLKRLKQESDCGKRSMQSKAELLLDHLFQRLETRLNMWLNRVPLDMDYLEFVYSQELVFLNAISSQVQIPQEVLDAMSQLHEMVCTQNQTITPTIVAHEQGSLGRPRTLIDEEYTTNLINLGLPFTRISCYVL